MCVAIRGGRQHSRDGLISVQPDAAVCGDRDADGSEVSGDDQ
jgi:hypothetical protein